MRASRPVRRYPVRRPEMIVIKTSEFSTIAVLVAATAVVVAVQQHRERERRLPPPPAIEAAPVGPSTDARLVAPTGVDLAVTSQPTSTTGGARRTPRAKASAERRSPSKIRAASCSSAGPSCSVSSGSGSRRD